MNRILITLLVIVIVSLPGISQKAEILQLSVESGNFERINTPVSFGLEGVSISDTLSFQLFEKVDGKLIEKTFQIEPGYIPQLWWVLDGTTSSGKTREYFLYKNTPQKFENRITTVVTPESIVLKNGNSEILHYQTAVLYPPAKVDNAYKRSGFIHPLFTPSGNLLTRVSPPDHYHHIGIWNPWTRVKIGKHVTDFWNLYEKQGTVRFAGINSTVNGPVYGGFSVRQEHIDFQGKKPEELAINEVWDVRAWNVEPVDGLKAWLVDLTTFLSVAGDSTIVFEAYRYGGGIGIRANEEWTKDNSTVLTSEGKTRKDADGTRARWTDLNGAFKNNGQSGITFFSHPANREHPEPMRVWPIDANNGRGDVYFEFCPIRHKDWVLIPGNVYRLKYRMLVYDGKIDRSTADRIWNDFAYPPVVRLSGKSDTSMEKIYQVKLITVDPGHFHAALVQKIMYDQVSPDVHVYAPQGPDYLQHLDRIKSYNGRPVNPTSWNEIVYTGPDFFEKMIADKPGNVVVLSGNNRKKAEYITKSINAGLNVLADKPMIIGPEDFPVLEAAFTTAKEKGVLLYDIMTERYEVTTILQKLLSQKAEIFGTLTAGSKEEPAVTKLSVHHFSKIVSGSPLLRPAWFFDVQQQGEGIVDVTTHLVDLVQWECFPEQILNPSDINMVRAKRWPTLISKEEFKGVTGFDNFPDYLQKDVKEGKLNVFANGEMVYRIKGIYAKVSVEWKYQAPPGGGDTHYSVMHGTKCDLIIKQGAEEKFLPTLYIENVKGTTMNDFVSKLKETVGTLPFDSLQIEAVNTTTLKINVPIKYRMTHEEHFGQVTAKFLEYLKVGKLPEWEVPGMITKYYTTTSALKLAKGKQVIIQTYPQRP